MDNWLHIAAIGASLIFSGLAGYISYRLLSFKEDITKVIRENCVSKDSFDAHEKQDQHRFETVEATGAARHAELRQDIAKVEKRVDSILIGNQ